MDDMVFEKRENVLGDPFSLQKRWIPRWRAHHVTWNFEISHTFCRVCSFKRKSGDTLRRSHHKDGFVATVVPLPLAVAGRDWRLWRLWLRCYPLDSLQGTET